MKWKISIGSTLVIWAILAGFIYYWNQEIPSQLPKESLLSPNVEDKSKEDNSEQKDLKTIIEEVQKVVVMIELENDSLGSGFLYNEHGDVITNAHVVSGAETVKIKTQEGNEFEGTVIGISDKTDVAVVRVPGLMDLEPLHISDEKGEIGDEVLALGSPLGLQNTVTTGIISGVGRNFEIDNFSYTDSYQISAPIAPGNSGGPLVNKLTGQVVGINSAVIDQGTIGFSIPIVNVLNTIEKWSDSPMTVLPTVSPDNRDNLGNQMEGEAAFLVNYFYETVNSGDYVTAYSLLGSNWQSKTEFTIFREGYLNTTSVFIDDVEIVGNDGNNIILIGIVTAEERKNDTYVTAKYNIEYTVGLENDTMKIITGQAKKIE